MNEPLFSTTAATGKTTCAISVISLSRISRETTNFFESESLASAEISNGSTPPTNTAVVAPLIISFVARPVSVGSALTPQAAATSTRAAASEIKR